MSDGFVQWYDAVTGEAAVAKGGRSFRIAATEIDPAARYAGAPVCFSVRHEHGVEHAVGVRLRSSTAVPEPSDARPSRPVEIAHEWAQHLRAGDIAAALALYAPSAQLDVGGKTIVGREGLRAYLEDSALIGIDRVPLIRADGDVVVVRWDNTGRIPASVEVWCRIALGQLVKQSISEGRAVSGPVLLSTAHGLLEISIVTQGDDVVDDARAYAIRRLGPLIEHIAEPVLFARIKLTQTGARERSATVQASVDVNGDLVRAHVSGRTMREAIDLVHTRLRDRLEHRAQHREARRQRSAAPEPGRWRHGDPATERPAYFDRPVEERELVRYKTYVLDHLTAEEAVFDMDQRGFDFYLFRALATGEEALVQRRPDGSCLLTGVRENPARPMSNAIAVAEHPAPVLSLDEAIERLGAHDERFIFFLNRATGRGNVVYHRYDGHYGLIAPDASQRRP
jgi:ribosome-associated translation inhibitor RaiA